MRACAFAAQVVQQQGFADLLFDAVQRVERGHRLLEDHRDAVAAQLAQVLADAPSSSGRGSTEPRVSAPASGSSCRIEWAVTDLPEPDSPTSARHSPGRCPGSGCAPRLAAEGDAQVADFDQVVAHRTHSSGSNASRNASPMNTSNDRISAR
jgi:hypothetical protein